MLCIPNKSLFLFEIVHPSLETSLNPLHSTVGTNHTKNQQSSEYPWFEANSVEQKVRICF